MGLQNYIDIIADGNDQDDVDVPNIDEQIDETYGARSGKYDLRPRRPRDYAHMHATLESTVMTQHNIKKDIKLFGDAGVNAVLKELQQLHDRKVLEPKDATKLSGDDKRAALQYLMFLKQKRNGTIKGRGCADGRKQRPYTAKEDASSPTVAIESVIASIAVAVDVVVDVDVDVVILCSPLVSPLNVRIHDSL